VKRILPAAMLLCITLSASADEGMWTIDNFPSARVAEKYGIDIDAAWLRHAQLATTRLESGCTGSFASPDGLMLTNNHCVWACIRNLSTDERNLSDDGFLAGSRGEELRCPGEQASVLVALEDVTAKVTRAIAGLDEDKVNDARKAELTRLESACEEASGKTLRCSAVSLYNGGQYVMHQYKRYDDVRLVFAPELDIGAFGGDPDNFQFPRWSLDMSFLRAYENGEPAATPHYFAWRRGGPAAGEPVLITGHPGGTARSLTVSQLRFQRNIQWPHFLLRSAELRGRLLEWQKTGPEAARIVQQRILNLENGIKVRFQQLRALQNDEMMAIKAADERALRERAGDETAWELIDGAMAAFANMYDEYVFIESGAAFQGDLFAYARTLVRGTAERELPNDKRMREYTDAALPQVEQRLLAARPVSKDYDELMLAFSLAKMREWLGPDSPHVHMVLGKASPEALAAQLVEGTKLADPAYRKALWEGGAAAVKASVDPMIRLALAIDADARAIRKRYEDEVEAPRIRAESMIADLRFELYGTDTYPDATFTLRVTYGAVEGWDEKGVAVDPITRTRRLFERATGERPFRLPASWVAAKDKLDPDTPFNFAATTDITGGNSGSPILAADGALVGLAFDGNIHSIAGEYWFDPSTNRSVGVNTAIMLEALEKVYGAGGLLEELTVVD
jgi:hypothetical protein